MMAVREMLWLIRLGNARLCAAACRAAIQRERHALDRALRAEDNATTHLRILAHEHRPGIPEYLLRREEP